MQARRILASALSACALSGVLSAAEVPGPLDFSGQVEVLSRLLGGAVGRYRVVTLDDFEGDRVWKPYSPSAQLDDLVFLKMKPDHQAFEDEAFLCRVDNTEKSLLLHFAFQTPGRNQFVIRPVEPVRLPGQPLRVSIWVKSGGYLHTLKFVFRNANGLKVDVPAGRLDFRGWRRIELNLPQEMHERGRRLEHRYSSSLESIVVESSPHEKAGAVSLSLDQFILLSDYHEFRYPGADIQDTWSNEVPTN